MRKDNDYSDVVGTCVVHGKMYSGKSIMVCNDEDVYVDGVLQTAEDGLTLDQAAYDRWSERRRKFAEKRYADASQDTVEMPAVSPYGERFVKSSDWD